MRVSSLLIGRALVGEVILGAAHHVEVVLASTFSLFWEECSVRLDKSVFLGLADGADDVEVGAVALELDRV